MIRYSSNRQISIEEFKTPFRFGMDKNNRWVKLANQLPWDDLARVYVKSMREDFGRPGLSPRVVLGALIIKHKLCLSDEETVEMIREHPYLQYFLGYEEFSHERPFDSSLFVYIRRRLGEEVFNQMSEALMLEASSRKDRKKKSKKRSAKGGDSNANPDETKTIEAKREDKPGISEKSAEHRGKLILDATVAPADIRYPTDLDLLNHAREKSEGLIDCLYQAQEGKIKPRSYRRRAKQEYLSVAKRKKRSVKLLREAIKKQLNYLRRNFKTIHSLLDSYHDIPLNYLQLRALWIIQELYRQQREMYEERTHRIADRLVSLSQPHIRPIVRGKSGKEVEFGAQVSASYIDGYVFIDNLSWEAVHEGKDLRGQVEAYHKRFLCYPEAVLGDKKYGTRENRAYLKSMGIKFLGKALGRPAKELSLEQKKQRKRMKKHLRERVKIEGKFGQGKRAYDLGLIKARTPQTSASWIAAVFFMMNLTQFIKEFIFWLFSMELIFGKNREINSILWRLT